jgi:hypothetical protein
VTPHSKNNLQTKFSSYIWVNTALHNSRQKNTSAGFASGDHFSFGVWELALDFQQPHLVMTCKAVSRTFLNFIHLQLSYIYPTSAWDAKYNMNNETCMSANRQGS